ncbi:glycosyltransferase family 2 protein [Bowmanella yangjiangensis]|uniref:glycosyltransferase family 2 protein n=1 Tax=Bowmanella yangjiangensis TaxID=2811230 RepID=UPI001E3281EB|nr:glycosyltransferase family 2 protein [Bowmanella yangjiangensis]
MKIGAVVILYKPDLTEARALLGSLARQVDLVCVIDNSPLSMYSPLTLSEHGNLAFHHYPNNLGIATAQNEGLKQLIEAGCKYALLFDQDSQFETDFVARMTYVFQKTKRQNLKGFAAIGPSLVCAFTQEIVRPRIQTEIERFDDVSSVPQIIASGMMIDLDHLQQVGFKDDSLFIDGVDHEWCWRAREHGFSIGLALNIFMLHRLGDGRRKFAGIPFKVGSPVRLYYQFRNIFILSRRSYVPLYWKLRNFAVMPLRIFANSILLPNRMIRLRFMTRGILDGMRNRSGPLRENAKK